MPTYTPHRKIVSQAIGHLHATRALLTDAFDENEFPATFPHETLIGNIGTAIETAETLHKLLVKKIEEERDAVRD